jgi:hypothetical protein
LNPSKYDFDPLYHKADKFMVRGKKEKEKEKEKNNNNNNKI